MLCEKCQKKNATHKITENINGKETRLNLCDDCAKEYGIGNFDKFFAQDFGFSEFINSFFNFGLNEENKQIPFSNEMLKKRCPVCQKSFEDIASSGKLGCACCYTTFRDEIIPSIEKIHGKTRHIGGVPSSAGKEMKIKHEINSLEKQLKNAINTQEFEKAAIIRDKIADLKAKEENKIIIDDDKNSTPKENQE